MSPEEGILYPLDENGLPSGRFPPQQIERFKEGFNGYPAKIVVNPKHRVTWPDYPIAAPMKIPPSIEPLSNDIPGREMQGYRILIEYDEKVDVRSLKCVGFQPLRDS